MPDDARFKVDGLPVTKPSNTVTDAIKGVTLNLAKTNVGAPVTVTVDKDSDTIKKNVQGFVDAYNKIAQHGRQPDRVQRRHQDRRGAQRRFVGERHPDPVAQRAGQGGVGRGQLEEPVGHRRVLPARRHAGAGKAGQAAGGDRQQLRQPDQPVFVDQRRGHAPDRPDHQHAGLERRHPEQHRWHQQRAANAERPGNLGARPPDPDRGALPRPVQCAGHGDGQHEEHQHLPDPAAGRACRARSS